MELIKELNDKAEVLVKARTVIKEMDKAKLVKESVGGLTPREKQILHFLVINEIRLYMGEDVHEWPREEWNDDLMEELDDLLDKL